MKLLLENWRQYLNEKRWEDYDAPKGEWIDVPLEDIKQGAIERGGEVNIADELYDLIDNAYSKIGGHLNLPNVKALPDKYTDWVAVDLDDDPEPDATRFSKGPKMSGSGHDGTRKAIDAYLAETAKLLRTEGFYGEMSKGIAHIMIKYHNVPFVPSQEDVEKVLEKPVKWLGPHPEGKYTSYDGWYIREIGGHDEMKIMVGNPIGIETVQP
tara:strand:+ start:12679 stop:13311 length:633 start_codon:yes stop_codon:yes gene_type:complete